MRDCCENCKFGIADNAENPHSMIDCDNWRSVNYTEAMQRSDCCDEYERAERLHR